MILLQLNKNRFITQYFKITIFGFHLITFSSREMSMKSYPLKLAFFILLPVALAFSFWYSPAWMKLCYGLALFLFGMQSIEEGLNHAAGGTLERLMGKSTSTPTKGLLFGMGATFILQSSTLVSLLTIAFLSAGMIGLAGGIAVILGTNLGATSGIWLLAVAGQSVSLSPAAIPMLIFGILAGFFKGKFKGLGRVLIGIALIFLGIDAIKTGFNDLGGQIDLAAIRVSGILEIFLFTGIGLLLTIVLQSSHATLILTLAALSGGQINLAQAFAVALGSNVGSSLSTAFVGMLGSNRGGQRLAMAHLIFNIVTALLALILWLPMTHAVTKIGEWLAFNNLLQLALYHTLFNLLGLIVFWFFQQQLAQKLTQWLPEKSQGSLDDEMPPANKRHARFLDNNMLRSGDTAVRALWQETARLNALSLEVIAQSAFLPEQALLKHDSTSIPPPDEAVLQADARQFYETLIKPLYGELIEFAGKADIDDESYRNRLMLGHVTSLRLVEIVKDGKHLQKNMRNYLQQPDSPVYPDYLHLRSHLLESLRYYQQAITLPFNDPERIDQTALLAQHIEILDTSFRSDMLAKLRGGLTDSWQTSSLMNDITYVKNIGLGLLGILREDVCFPNTTEQNASPEASST